MACHYIYNCYNYNEKNSIEGFNVKNVFDELLNGQGINYDNILDVIANIRKKCKIDVLLLYKIVATIDSYGGGGFVVAPFIKGWFYKLFRGDF